MLYFCNGFPTIFIYKEKKNPVMSHKFFFITCENNHLNVQRCYITILFKNSSLTSQIPPFIAPFSALFMLVCPDRVVFPFLCTVKNCIYLFVHSHIPLSSEENPDIFSLSPSLICPPASSTSDFHVVTSNRQSAVIIPFHLPAEFERAGISTF